MKEFRRIFLGEFVDDFEIGRKISDAFGIKKNPENTEQKIGEERMGNGDIVANMGISYLLISIAIFLLIMIVFVGAYLSKKYALSEKI